MTTETALATVEAGKTQSASLDTRPVYEGLSWSEGRGARPLLVGGSKVTPLRYVIDLSMAPESFLLLTTFRRERLVQDQKDRTRKSDDSQQTLPQAESGRFSSVEEAMHAAERDDFRYVVRMELAQGRMAVFSGSERVRNWRDEQDNSSGDDEALEGGEAFLHDLVARSASYFTATKTAAKQNADGSKQVTFRVEAGNLPVWLDHAPMGEHVMLAAIDSGENSAESDSDHDKRVREAVKHSHLLAREAGFQKWLFRYDHWGLLATASRFNSQSLEEATEETLRRICGIFSRKEFATNRDALEHFERLRREYYRDLSLDFHKPRG